MSIKFATNFKMSEELKNAISRNDLKKIQEILCTRHVDLNYRYMDYSPLLNACVKGTPVIVGALVKAGANVNGGVSHDKITELGRPLNQEIGPNGIQTVTPLIVGVVNRNLELVKKLLQDCGADVNATNTAGMSPLLCIPTNRVDSYRSGGSTAQVKQEIANLLLKAGADVNACDGKGQTPLHRAVTAKDLDSARILLENGAQVDIADNNGSTALHIASREVNTQFCQLLIQHEGGKTAVNHKARDGATPLHVAIEAIAPWPKDERMAVIQLLIDNGADLASQKHGLTPLHLAAEAGLTDIVKMLVEAGADIHAEALKTGLTPVDMAMHTKKQAVVDYLVAKAAESENDEGGRPKRDSPSVGQEEDNGASQQTDTPVEEILKKWAVGGFQQVLVIKDSTDKE